MDIKDKKKTNILIIQDYLSNNGIDFFILPRADKFQGEYVAPCDERLAWLTGFTGSSGTCIVGKDKSALFVDGRYTVQAKKQINNDIIELNHLSECSPSRWLYQNIDKGVVVGIDPWYFTPSMVMQFKEVCSTGEANLVFLDKNPIDIFWYDQPPYPHTTIVYHGFEFSGEKASHKLERLRSYMKENNIDVQVVTDPTCVSWLFNIRASDLEFTPVALTYSVITSDTVYLFVDDHRLDYKTRKSLKFNIEFYDFSRLSYLLNKFNHHVVSLDKETVPYKVYAFIKDAGGNVVYENPIPRWKACKNTIEINGIKKAHVRDGVAICYFIHWFKNYDFSNVVDEFEVAKKLEYFRESQKWYISPSYYPISATGPNSAICHYQPVPGKSRNLREGDVFLIDSGGQYMDGTTDFTRVLPVGNRPTQEQIFHYTIVLKAHISLASLRFPAGTTGRSLDAIARVPLWREGIDYDHGTGHGVGCYLSVHEGPQKIAKEGTEEPLEPGMILSIEPGYYREDQYGIRFENLVVVVRDQTVNAESEFLKFEPLTLVPIEMSMIVRSLLDEREMLWVNEYNNMVLERLRPYFDLDVYEYFENQKNKSLL